MGRSVVGVLVGGIADIVASNIISIPLVIVAMLSVDLTLPPEKLSPAIMAAIRESPGLFTLAFIFGAACSILGGYVAAWIARRRHVVIGALSSYLCFGIGVYSLIAGSGQMPLWLHAVLLLLSPALGGIGGYLRQRRMMRSGGDTPPVIQPEPSVL
jgi:MFS family permease